MSPAEHEIRIKSKLNKVEKSKLNLRNNVAEAEDIYEYENKFQVNEFQFILSNSHVVSFVLFEIKRFWKVIHSIRHQNSSYFIG